MAFGSLSPVAIQQFFDANGDPLAGGSLGLYLAGTNTPSPAYADQALSTPLANPVVLDAAGRAPELFLDALSYKQVLKNALGTTIWTADNIRSAALLAQTSFQPAVTTITSTGTVNNVITGVGHNRVLVCANNAGDLTITGVAGGIDGDTLLIVAVGTANVYLTHNDLAHSGPGNILVNKATSGPTPLVGGYGMAMYQYFATSQFWRLINHDQGHFIQLPWVAGNFLTDVGTWTVSQAAQVELKYLLVGSTIETIVTIGPATMAGSPVRLNIAGWPYAFYGIPTASAQPTQHTGWSTVQSDGSAPVLIAYITNSARAISLVKQDAAPILDGNHYLYGQGRWEVQ